MEDSVNWTKRADLKEIQRQRNRKETQKELKKRS